MEKRFRKSMNRNASRIIVMVILFLGVGIMLLPFLWMVLTAFKTYQETVQIPIQWFPKKISLDNFRDVLNGYDFISYYKNTIVVTVAITLLQIVVCSMAAYGFARLDAPGKNVLFMLVLAMLMVPDQMMLIPSYNILRKMGMINTVWVLIIPRVASSYGTFFLRQFFATLPRELEEAAVLDGCSPFRSFCSIILPLARTPIAAFAIFTVLWAWNDLIWPLIMTSSDSVRVLSVAISALVGQSIQKNNVLMAASLMAVLPMIVVFIVFQKKLLAGIANTGVKA